MVDVATLTVEKSERLGCIWTLTEEAPKKYIASKSEICLEELCREFGTELLSAEVNPGNGTKLFRLSRPVFVGYQGAKAVVQFQIARFSPLLTGGYGDVYEKNARAERQHVSRDDVDNLIAREHPQWDVFAEVTNPRYISNVHVKRWKEQVYIALFRDVDDSLDGKVKPFLIHENFTLQDRRPYLRITLSMPAVFNMRSGVNMQEGSDQRTENTLVFEHSESWQDHVNAANTALSHADSPVPQHHFYEWMPSGLQVSYKIPCDVPAQHILGFIQRYLQSVLKK